MKFVERIEINEPAQVIFELTQDYDRRLAWDPFLKVAELVDGATAADVGVKAWCVATNGIGMETEYVSFQPPKVTAVSMTKGPFFYESFAGSWRFNAVAAQRTEVVFTYLFVLKRPFRLATPLMTAFLRRSAVKRLVALKNYVERGF